jgi:hypothetical protein
MRNYPLLINLYLLINGKYKVTIVSPDVKCLQDFTRTVANFNFKLTLINALLIRDFTRIYIYKMLIKARLQEEFDYNIKR